MCAISDWSSDVCSSDLSDRAAVDPHPREIAHRVDVEHAAGEPVGQVGRVRRQAHVGAQLLEGGRLREAAARDRCRGQDRKSGEEGKRVSVRVDLGGSRIIKKTTQKKEKKTYYTK